MDKYDKMLLLFYKGDKWKGHNPFQVKKILMELDKRGQLEEDWEGDKLVGFTGWIKTNEAGLDRIKRNEIPNEDGDNVVPMYWASSRGIKGVRTMIKNMQKAGRFWFARKGYVRGGYVCRG